MNKIGRILGVIAVVGALAAAIIFSMKGPSTAELIWDKDTVIGSPDAKNHFIIYSDLLCPYCVAFENAMAMNEESVEEYAAEHDVAIEVRVSEFLYRYGESRPINSHYSAEAVFCAKKEGKFWDYYNTAIKKVWSEYFAQMGKGAFSEMAQLNKEYWVNIGKEVGLGNTFADCVYYDQTADEVLKVTEKTAKLVNGGMPYFKFNEWTTSGFDLSWGYEHVLQYFEAGLKSKK